MGQLIPEDQCTEEAFLLQLERMIHGDTSVRSDEGGLLNTLLCLYAGMLADTAERLNQLPEKHRAAFLNLQQPRHRPARPADTAAVFEVVEGYDKTVVIPKGALIAAQGDGEPVLFRTKQQMNAIPSNLEHVIWVDRETDVVQSVEIGKPGEICSPFRLWDKQMPLGEQHFVDFFFSNIFTTSGDNGTFFLTVELELDEKPLQAAMLTDATKFAWSIHTQPGEEDAPSISADVTAKMMQNGTLCLSYKGVFCPKSTIAWLRLELLDTALAGLTVCSISAYSQQTDILPEAVVLGERELDAASFYPFENPMQSLGECFIFCGEALFRPGAEITVEFDLALVQTLVEIPKVPETIDYKWIMKRPQPKPEPTLYEAFAQAVRLEYWNGASYCEVRAKYGKSLDFSAEEKQITIRFDCPEDMVAGEAGGRNGYFLRLSSEFCDALYQMPRRVYTPLIENLCFSYCYLSSVSPQKIIAENFGNSKEMSSVAFQPFVQLPYEQALFLGFKTLPANTRIQVFIDVEKCPEENTSFLSMEHYGGSNRRQLSFDDGTYGFTRSGVLSILLPHHINKATLFGKHACWLCLTPPHRQGERTIKGIYLNGQWVENRVRHVFYLSYSALQEKLDADLPHGNIAKAKVTVRVPEKGEWEQWAEYEFSDGKFRNGFYIIDCHVGTVTFPKSILALAVPSPGEDFVEITYDICDGAQGNVGVAAINKMQDELPFIASVFNPLAVVNGEDSEPNDRMAERLEHRLYHNGRAVSTRDFELIAKDLYPQIHDVRCLSGRPIRLIVLLKDEKYRSNLPLIQLRLSQEFERIGCAAAAGTQVEILEATFVPLHISAKLKSKKHILSTTIEALRSALTGFLNPVSGGLRGTGWQIGVMPVYEQVEAFIITKTPDMVLESLEMTAEGGELYGDYQKIKPQAYHVPGAVQIELDVRTC